MAGTRRADRSLPLAGAAFRDTSRPFRAHGQDRAPGKGGRQRQPEPGRRAPRRMEGKEPGSAAPHGGAVRIGIDGDDLEGRADETDGGAKGGEQTAIEPVRMPADDLAGEERHDDRDGK